jgi:hypothetical protein
VSAVVLTVAGDSELAAKLKKYGVSILDLRASMDQTGKYLTGFFSGEVFASRGQVIGKPWQELDARYAAHKAREFPGRPPLIRTGLMQRSFKHQSTKLSTRLFNEAEYFDYHQGGHGVPQRVMMLVDQTRERAILQLIGADLAGKQRAADV